MREDKFTSKKLPSGLLLLEPLQNNEAVPNYSHKSSPYCRSHEWVQVLCWSRQEHLNYQLCGVCALQLHLRVPYNYKKASSESEK